VMLFFIQADDGLRCATVTGVQTCALPICSYVAEFDDRRCHRLSAHLVTTGGWHTRLRPRKSAPGAGYRGVSNLRVASTSSESKESSDRHGEGSHLYGAARDTSQGAQVPPGLSGECKGRQRRAGRDESPQRESPLTPPAFRIRPPPLLQLPRHTYVDRARRRREAARCLPLRRGPRPT